MYANREKVAGLDFVLSACYLFFPFRAGNRRFPYALRHNRSTHFYTFRGGTYACAIRARASINAGRIGRPQLHVNRRGNCSNACHSTAHPHPRRGGACPNAHRRSAVPYACRGGRANPYPHRGGSISIAGAAGAYDGSVKRGRISKPHRSRF